MITVKLSVVDSGKIAVVQSVIDDFILTDCDFSGATIEIEKNCDFTCVDGGEELSSMKLFNAVSFALNPHDESFE